MHADDLGPSGRDEKYGYGLVDADEMPVISDNPPSCTIVDPVDSQTLSGTYRVLVSASDDNSISKVELSIDSGTQIDITDYFDGTHYYYDWDTTTVSDGSHTLEARATDDATQTTNSDQITVTVDNNPSSGSTMHVTSIDMHACFALHM